MAQGGKVDVDSRRGLDCKEAIQYFEQHAGPYGVNENSAEYFLEAIGADTIMDVPVEWSLLWSSSELGKLKAIA